MRVTFNESAFRSLVIQASEGELRQRANRVLNAARREAPVDTGRLRASLAVTFGRDPSGNPTARIGSNLPHAVFVHEGTGIYGPSGSPIRPRGGQFLRFPVRNNSGSGNRRYRGGATAGFVYAREVRGMRGRPFLLNALSAAE